MAFGETHFLSDYLEPDDKVFLFDALVARLDLSELYASYTERGGSVHSPRIMFSILLFAYFEGIHSAYAIHNKILYDLRYIFLAGNTKISRRAISDFRVRNLSFLETMFAQTVDLAYAVKLINFNSPFALDGTKIKANAGRQNTKTREEYIQYQEEILQHVKNYLAECEESDRQVLAESGKDTAKEFEAVKERIENLEIKKIQTKKTEEENNDKKKSDEKKEENDSTKKKNKKKLKTIDSIESAQGLLNLYEKIEDACEQNPDKKYINLTDPDSGLMKNKGIPQDSYNAEAISNNQIIVSVDVTQDEQDQFQLKPMTEKLQKLLQSWNILTNIHFLADAGYNAGYNLFFLELQKNIDAYISMYQRETENSKKTYPKDSKFAKEKFVFYEEKNRWKCPMGNFLHYQKIVTNDRVTVKHYHATREECLLCSENKNCIKTKGDKQKGYRTIEDRNLASKQRMQEKMKKEESKEIYKKRSPEIEGVFGQIKHNKHFKRFSLRGLKKVRGEFFMVAAVHNIRKILKYRQEEIRQVTEHLSNVRYIADIFATANISGKKAFGDPVTNFDNGNLLTTGAA